MAISCTALLASPYREGWHCIQQGLQGKTLPRPQAPFYPYVEQRIPLLFRVSAVVTGLFLWIPIINHIVFALLRVAMRKQSAALPREIDHLKNATPVRVPTPVDPALLQGVRINDSNLEKAPQLFDLALVLQGVNDASPAVKAEELLRQFDELNRGKSPADHFTTDGRQRLSVNEARSVLNDYYLSVSRNLERNRPRAADHQELLRANNYQELWQAEITTLLKGICLELRKPTISPAAKTETFVRLVRAAQHCAPRRHSEALIAYRQLINQVETVEEVVLEYVQNAKEELFTNFYSASYEPVQTLNWIRSRVGRELGLDIRPVNLQDPHIGLHNAAFYENGFWGSSRVVHRTDKELLTTFFRIYTPANLIPIIKMSLNERISRNPDFCTNISQFIDHTIRNKAGISKEVTDQLPAPYQDESTYQLTDEGVKFLLVHFGIVRT